METAVIQAETRQPGGRHANNRLRRRGLVPAVVYGHGRPPETIALSRHDLVQALEHVRHVVTVAVAGQEQRYLLKDVQYDHLQEEPIHVDLMRVSADERVTVPVDIEFRGEPKGVHEGGAFIRVLTKLAVECPLLAIPTGLRVKVDHLGVGDTLHVRDLDLPEGVLAQAAPDEVVATVRAKRGLALEEEAAAEPAPEQVGGEPQVIGRAAKEEEPEGEG